MAPNEDAEKPTTIIVSLFLPQTVHWGPKVKEEETVAAPDLSRSVDDISKATPAADTASQKVSLIEHIKAATPPVTPAPIERKGDDFFSSGPPTPATHFPRPFDPRTLVRSDSHVAEWSGGQLFNQPRPRAPSASLETIPENVPVQSPARARNHSRRPTRRASPSGKHPHEWSQEWQIVPADQGNGGLTNAVRAAQNLGDLGPVLSVGLVGFPTDDLPEDTRAEIYDKLENDYDSLAVFVNHKDFEGHYVKFCKIILWPVFHYVVPDHPKSKAYADNSWKYYEKLNQAFADKVVASYKHGDIIWVHDYHLLLVPGMIRKKLPNAQIGFFLHAAFPSSEVFRCLAKRVELLQGMHGANLVVFQTQEYGHHFMQTCSRILSVEAAGDGIQLDSHFVNVWWLPIGIDPQRVSIYREEANVLELMKELKAKFGDKRLIVARDKMDSIRGVKQKLLAFELFLNTYPEWKGKVVLIQVATSDVENKDLNVTISEIVTRIDAVHTTLEHNPLLFLRQDVDFDTYLTMLSLADALMITSLRDGMNLTVHEFVVCQDGKTGGKKHSPVILSEFTGSAAVFDGAHIPVNPWDIKGCADAINKALLMGEEEKERRWNMMREIVEGHTGDKWVEQLSKQLAKVHRENFRRDTMSIPRLSLQKLSQGYQDSHKRLFVLDYEGTLATWGNVSNTVLISPQRVTDVLSDLMADERNVIYIMSARTIEELEMIFSRLPGIGLIAENGSYIRDMYMEDWIAFHQEEETNKWKNAVKDMMTYYLERVEHSWLEERHCSIIFHYKKSDEFDAAARHAGEAADHINAVLSNQRVRAFPAKDCIIIEPMDWDKGTALSTIYHSFFDSPEQKPSFLMVAGNDRDDEVAFRWANKAQEEGKIREVFTVSLGNTHTAAMSTLTNGTTGLLAALSKLSKLPQN